MRRFRTGIASPIIFIIAFLFMALPPVTADGIYPTITDIYFEKDGLPFNDSLQFTVNCYGYACKSWDCGRDPEDLRARDGNFTPELVFSYHATCPVYGCRIYEPYYHAERHFGTHCTMEGTTPKGSFILMNFSRSAVPHDCKELHPYDIGKGEDEYYRVTQGFTKCENESREANQVCDKFVIPCTPGMDADCGNRNIDGAYVKDSDQSRVCREQADQNKRACEKYLEKVDPSTLVMWRNSETGNAEPARRSCALHLTIPPDPPASTESSLVSSVPEIAACPGDRMPDITYGTRAVATASSFNPLEILYCSILRFPGGRCGA